MIPYYEELNDEEKNAVTKVIRTLLKQTFVLERKYHPWGNVLYQQIL